MPFREIFLQVKTLLKALSPGKRIALATVLISTVFGIFFLTVWSDSQDFQVLYSNLAPEDAGAILAKLKDEKIPYQISGNGSSILIPRGKIYEERLALASQGLPQGGGVGFEIFDNTKLGMTEFVQNVNYQRALQGELSRTINGFTEVESTRVHIVMPSKSLFVDEEKPATASVVLKLRPGRWLSNEQVQGILHLLSSSVPGLKTENVTIVDNTGKILTGLRKKSEAGAIDPDQLVFQNKINKNLEDRIKGMLDTALGPGNAIVTVSCSLDFKQQEKTEETYQPQNKVARSEQILNETSIGRRTIPMGVPGVASNVGPGKAKENVTKGPVNPEFKKQDKTVNYEIGKVVSHVVEPIGKIKKISVAVIVDGIYKLVKGEKGGKDWKYFPRSQEDMRKLENIVKRAMSFDPARGDQLEVVNIPFEGKKARLTEVEAEKHIAKKEETSWLSGLKKHMPLTKHVFLGFSLLLSFIFVARPLIKWLTSTSIKDLDISKQLPMTVGEAERQFGGRKGLPFTDKAAQMIARDKENSVELMRGWLNER